MLLIHFGKFSAIFSWCFLGTLFSPSDTLDLICQVIIYHSSKFFLNYLSYFSFFPLTVLIFFYNFFRLYFILTVFSSFVFNLLCKASLHSLSKLNGLIFSFYKFFLFSFQICFSGFSGGPVVKNPPCNAGDTSPILGLGRSDMLWGN